MPLDAQSADEARSVKTVRSDNSAVRMTLHAQGVLCMNVHVSWKICRLHQHSMLCMTVEHEMVVIFVIIASCPAYIHIQATNSLNPVSKSGTFRMSH